MVEPLTCPELTWQPSLLDSGLDDGSGGEFDDPSGRINGCPDSDFSSLVRHRLDDCCWVDHAPGWLSGSDSVFEQVLASGTFRQRERWMYERMVDEPRLVSPLPIDQLPPAIGIARRLLSERYGADFDSVFVNLYRDGRDSVAWHGDTIGRSKTEDTMVAILSFGEARRLSLRPRNGGSSLTFPLGHGDLIVMGGSCQRTWEHAILKTARPVGPRISVQYRPHNVR
jgi:alkylated DNA repair dioxygenase AlkB